MVDTRASRPWFRDYSQAQSPEQAARAVLDLVVRFGRVVPWRSGTPAHEQDQMLIK
jgi:hypothetical protein